MCAVLACRAALALVLLAFATAACGGASTPSGSSSPSAPGTASGTGTRVVVRMTEFHLALPRSTFAPGTYTFVAVNDGTTVHAIALIGPEVAGQRTQGLVQPGQSADLTVTLQPGSYEMYCPVDGHKAQGMDTRFTVSPSGGTGG